MRHKNVFGPDIKKYQTVASVKNSCQTLNLISLLVTCFDNPPLPPRMTTCRSCKQTQKSPRNTVRRHCGEWRRREPGSHRAQLWGRPASGPILSFPSFATSLAFSLLFLPTQSSTRPTGRAGWGHLSIHPCVQTDTKSNQPDQNHTHVKQRAR